MTFQHMTLVGAEGARQLHPNPNIAPSIQRGRSGHLLGLCSHCHEGPWSPGLGGDLVRENRSHSSSELKVSSVQCRFSESSFILHLQDQQWGAGATLKGNSHCRLSLPILTDRHYQPIATCSQQMIQAPVRDDGLPPPPPPPTQRPGN